MADEVVGRGIELAAVGRLLARGGPHARGPRRRRRGGHRQVHDLGGRCRGGHGCRLHRPVLPAGPLGAAPHPRRADRSPRPHRCRSAREPAGSAAARARDRPPPRGAVGDAPGPAHPVGGPRRPAPTPDRWRARPAGRRRRAVARRELRGHPCLCHQAAGGGTARGAGLGPDGVRRRPRRLRCSRPWRRIGRSASAWGRCRSRRSIACSSSGWAGRSRGSRWSGSKRSPVATRCTPWRSRGRSGRPASSWTRTRRFRSPTRCPP